ncbi:unnamed protein product [Sphagnum tenellum]
MTSVTCDAPVIYNIKASFRLKDRAAFETHLKTFGILSHPSVTKVRESFFVVKDKYDYIVFFVGFVNVTGIKNETLLPDASLHFARLFGLGDSILSSDCIPVIDNIVASAGTSLANVSLLRLCQLLQQRKKGLNIVKIHYNPEKFPRCQNQNLSRYYFAISQWEIRTDWGQV